MRRKPPAEKAKGSGEAFVDGSAGPVIESTIMKKPRPFKAVLFDMDGIILDTERVHVDGWHAVFSGLGMEPDEKFLVTLRGANLELQKQLFAVRYPELDLIELRKRRKAYCDEVYRREGIGVKTGYRELTDWLKERNIPRALCTSTAMETAAEELRMAGLEYDFDAAVTGTEPKHSKPEPDVFLLGAEKLGVKPEDCIVFEDSPNGVIAGHAAGCQVIMVPDTVEPYDDLEQRSIAVCGSLLEAKELLVTILGYT